MLVATGHQMRRLSNDADDDDAMWGCFNLANLNCSLLNTTLCAMNVLYLYS